MAHKSDTSSSTERRAKRRSPAAADKTPKSRRNAKTSHTLRWRDVTLRLDVTANYLSEGQTHLEIRVLKPLGALLPITETGYRSHFIATDDLANAGGELRFVLDWLEREARTRQWQEAEFRWRQGDLFAARPKTKARR